jgi:TPR repeat protein
LDQNLSFEEHSNRNEVKSMRTLCPRLLALVLCLSAMATWATSAEAGTKGIEPVLLAKAKVGDADAQYQVGNAYNYGRRVRRDYAQALNWYRKGAEQGNADAQFQLGGLYHFGHGVPRDAVLAFDWAKKAAIQGQIDAEFFISTCYSEGWGIGRNKGESVFWLQKAAEQGDARSQLYLALAYGTGTGVAKNYKEAYFWFSVAASRETERGRRKNDIKGRFHTGALLTPADLSQVQDRVKAWLQNHPTQSQ